LSTFNSSVVYLGQPVVGLNLLELRGRPAVADDRPLAVFLTVAEDEFRYFCQS
jgi:hypothetical protein